MMELCKDALTLGVAALSVPITKTVCVSYLLAVAKTFLHTLGFDIC